MMAAGIEGDAGENKYWGTFMRDAALWEAIQRAPLEIQSGSGKLRRIIKSSCQLSDQNCDRALSEYRKFLYLLAVTNEKLAPSPIVDFIWKTHAADPQTWPDGSRLVTVWPPAYVRSKGLLNRDPAYWATLDRYREEFGPPLVAKAWPSPKNLRRYGWSFLVTGALMVVTIAFGMGGDRSSAAALGLATTFGLLVWLVVISPWGEKSD